MHKGKFEQIYQNTLKYKFKNSKLLITPILYNIFKFKRKKLSIT